MWLIFGSVGPKYEVIHQFWGPLLKNTPRTGQKTKKDGKMSFFLCFFVKIEKQIIYPAEKNIATHSDYYYWSGKFCFLCLKSFISSKIWKKHIKFGENDYLCFLLYVNWSWANHSLKFNDFPNKFRASLIKFQKSKQVAQVNARKWL